MKKCGITIGPPKSVAKTVNPNPQLIAALRKNYKFG